jgi:UDP-perosamine 4-acetyltransferase
VRRVVVLGAGGHARVCLDLLLEQDGIAVEGCLGDARDRPLQRPVLGGDEHLEELAADGVDAAFVALGDNRARERVTHTVRSRGLDLVRAVSQFATVSASATIGEGTAVMAGAAVNAYARIADGAIVNTGATLDHDCDIGPFAHVAPGCHLAGEVVVGHGAFLGIGTVVVPGVRIGPGATVGAGTVVLRDIPSGATVVGNPGVVIKLGALP